MKYYYAKLNDYIVGYSSPSNRDRYAPVAKGFEYLEDTSIELEEGTLHYQVETGSSKGRGPFDIYRNGELLFSVTTFSDAHVIVKRLSGLIEAVDTTCPSMVGYIEAEGLLSGYKNARAELPRCSKRGFPPNPVLYTGATRAYNGVLVARADNAPGHKSSLLISGHVIPLAAHEAGSFDPVVPADPSKLVQALKKSGIGSFTIVSHDLDSTGPAVFASLPERLGVKQAKWFSSLDLAKASNADVIYDYGFKYDSNGKLRNCTVDDDPSSIVYVCTNTAIETNSKSVFTVDIWDQEELLFSIPGFFSEESATRAANMLHMFDRIVVRKEV